MKESEWLDLAARINRLWPNQPIQDDTAAEWFLLLEDLAPEAISSAITALAVDGERFPPPAGVLRAKAVELVCDDDGATWAEVSAELRRAIRYHGVHRDPEDYAWSSDTVATLVRLVGWKQICLDEDPPGVREAQLRGKWQELRARDMRDRALDGLLGAPQRKALRERAMTSVAAILEERGENDGDGDAD